MSGASLLCFPLLSLAVVVPLAAPPLALALAAEEALMARAFLLTGGTALALSAPAFFVVRKSKRTLSARDGFLVVFLSWAAVSALGALPYRLSDLALPWSDALFESACGFATTGASVLADIEAAPRSLVLWRALTHWAGGMGIIMLTVALLPLLGIGGFQLVKAEAPGPEKEKITPKITGTAKVLYVLYCALTALLFLLYLAGGMSCFDAACHALSVMASGGVSTRNSGFAAFDSVYIEAVTTVFMLLTAMNYNLFYRLTRGKARELLDNTELKAYLALFAAAALLLTLSLKASGLPLARSFRLATFQGASFLSTTGTVLADYEAWPPLAQGVLFALLFVGGCSGSTAGGVKVIRHAVLWKQTGNELRRLLYPRGVFSVQLNRRLGRKDVVYGVAGFTFLYMATVCATALACAASGLDLLSALSCALAVTGNFGAGFGAIGPGRTWAAFPAALKTLFTFVMIAGRLELVSVFVLFTREYRRNM